MKLYLSFVSTPNAVDQILIPVSAILLFHELSSDTLSADMVHSLPRQDSSFERSLMQVDKSHEEVEAVCSSLGCISSSGLSTLFDSSANF